MPHLLHATLLIGIWLLPEIAQACAFDVDCTPGNRCIKSSGGLYGVCAGGLNPGNKHDSAPVYSPLDLNRTYGNTCSFDVDCGPGSICFKGRYGVEGACMRRATSLPPNPQPLERAPPARRPIAKPVPAAIPPNATETELKKLLAPRCNTDRDCANGRTCTRSNMNDTWRCMPR